MSLQPASISIYDEIKPTQQKNSKRVNKLLKIFNKDDEIDEHSSSESDSEDEEHNDDNDKPLKSPSPPQISNKRITKKQTPKPTSNDELYNSTSQASLYPHPKVSPQQLLNKTKRIDYKQMEHQMKQTLNNNNLFSNHEQYNTSSENQQSNEEQLIKKLNYMIYLLEEQQHQETNHTTEELILYCFLGIFTIFVIDSFTKVGKYIR